MTKRAVIYVRVSSEVQAERVSPQTQEQDCRVYCESRGYIVVEVYRDTEKYRVGRRLVEPSGTRSDRPQLRRMLADADAGKFDVLVAWREDRLYRGANHAMLDISERVRQGVISVELVKEHYDPTIAPVKAWAAGVELQAKHDRCLMGLSGRFAKGKVWKAGIPYGYRSVDDYYQIDPEESVWVLKIWQWYADGVSVREIRRRLIGADAPQSKRPRKETWGLPRIRKILRYATYHSGVQTITLDRQTFELRLPPIVDPETAKRVAERRERHKRYPAGNVKYDYLGLGLVYCGCCKWKMHTNTRIRISAPEGEYRCPKAFFGYPEMGCPKTIGWHKLDNLLWEKVLEFITDDERFEKELAALVDTLRREEADAEARCESLKKQLDELAIEQQRVITWARKQIITQAQLEMQLGALAIQEAGLKREYAEKSLLTGNRAQKLFDFANTTRHEIRAGLAGLEAKPSTPAEAKRQFAIKRQAVEALVSRVDVQHDRTIKVTFYLDLQMQNLLSGS